MNKKLTSDDLPGDAIDPPKLETRHYEWIFSTAQEHFVERIATLELENLRHQANLDQPLYKNTIQSLGDRQQKITQNNDYIQQYGEIVKFCMMVRERVMEVSAEEFAQKLAPFLKRKK